MLAALLAAMAGCSGRSSSNAVPPPIETPIQTESPPQPPKGIQHVDDKAPTLPPASPAGQTGSAPGTDAAGASPAFADTAPAKPLRYRDVDTISLAISYRLPKDQLHELLLSGRSAEERRQAEPHATEGGIANAPEGRYHYFMARIESCLLLVCDTHDDGVRSVANDPMVWHWAITPEHNEGGNTVIIIGIYARVSPEDAWTRVDAIPDIRERAKIESRSWFLDNWDKALSMLGAALAFLVTHWFRPGSRKDD